MLIGRWRSSLLALACVGSIACGGLVAREEETECITAPLLGGSERTEFVAGTASQERAVCQLEMFAAAGELLGVCSGTLIDSGWVLTAAHCLAGGPAAISISSPSLAGTAAISLAADQAIAHPFLDLMLIRVPTGTGEVLGADPVAADPETDVQLGELVQIGGVGASQQSGPGVRTFAVTRVQDVRDPSFRVYAERRASACSGDSGGPALVRNARGRLVVIGVLSTGSVGCSETDQYIRLAQASDWLRANGVAPPNDANVAADCALVGASGRCFHQVALWCDGDTPTAAPCTNGTTCGFVKEVNGYRCVPAGADPCGGVADRGACDGEVRLNCVNGELRRSACAACNAVCTFSVASGAAICNAAGDADAGGRQVPLRAAGYPPRRIRSPRLLW